LPQFFIACGKKSGGEKDNNNNLYEIEFLDERIESN